MTEHQWVLLREEYENRTRRIVIPSDINPGNAKPIIARLDALYTDVMLTYAEVKTEDDSVAQLLSNVLKTGATGTNTDARAANAINAARNYRMPDPTSPDGYATTVDLFGLKQVTNERLVFINSIIKILDGKQSRLITANGLMKIESIF